MSVKGKEILKRSDSRLKRTNFIIRLTIFVMFIIVMYDSFVFGIPFQYILFYFIGLFIGRMFKFSHLVQLDKETQKLNLRTNWVSIIFLIGLLLLRFLIGKPILESIHIAKVSDALYLFFIGIYYSKWRILLRQIDGIYYKMLKNLRNEKIRE